MVYSHKIDPQLFLVENTVFYFSYMTDVNKHDVMYLIASENFNILDLVFCFVVLKLIN